MNNDIRAMIIEKGLRAWQVAKAMGVHESVFSRLLRDQLSPEKRDQIITVINELNQRGGRHG